MERPPERVVVVGEVGEWVRVPGAPDRGPAVAPTQELGVGLGAGVDATSGAASGRTGLLM